jgi:hypothetical protein
LIGLPAFATSGEHIVAAGRRATSWAAVAQSAAAALPAHRHAVIAVNLCITATPASSDYALSAVASSRAAVAPLDCRVPTSAAISGGAVFFYRHTRLHPELSEWYGITLALM